MSSSSKGELDKIYSLEQVTSLLNCKEWTAFTILFHQKLAQLLECSASTLESLTELKSSTDAQQLLTTAPSQFSEILTVSLGGCLFYQSISSFSFLQDIRESFKQVIEAAPKPGIPYYDPIPLERLKNE
jgi:hypothetical protein